MLAKKALLLDLDGVVFRNNNAHRYVSNRCEDYVRKITGSKDYKNLNEQLYKSHGHTLLGLRKLGYTNSIKEFNDYVYDDMSQIKSVNLADTSALIKLKDRCRKNNVETYIFSNAPAKWCRTVLKKMNCHMTIIESDDFLKPQEEYYNRVHNLLKNKEILFVDDSLINLKSVQNTWSTYLFDTKNSSLDDII